MSTDSPKSEAAAAVSEPSPNERITAIVPARNEEMTIETCVRSLARQGEIAEIFVVNDHSTDRTAEVVRGLMGEIRNLQLLEAREIPAGWLGKNHAVWEGAKHATSRWLLFTDADAELRDGATARALRIAEETRAALVSFSPEQITEAWYERALIPFVYYRLAKYFPYDAVNDAKSGAAAANGQFLMIRGDVYDAIGGHWSVAGEVLEGVALAKRGKGAGYRSWVWFGRRGSVREDVPLVRSDVGGMEKEPVFIGGRDARRGVSRVVFRSAMDSVCFTSSRVESADCLCGGIRASVSAACGICEHAVA